MGLRSNSRGRLRLVDVGSEETLAGSSPNAQRLATPAAAVAAAPSPDASWAEAPKPRPRADSDPGLSTVKPTAFASLADAQLVALGAKGEKVALEILYRRHAAFAIHLATRIEGAARDVEDIAHDAFLRAFERLGDLTDRSAFRAWLGAIVVHAVRSRMRRARLMSVLGLGRTSEPVDLDAIASPDASPHVRAQIAQIYALLRTLPTDDRIAWTLRAVEGHDLDTVARLTRCSLATVKRRITRAQRFLDEHFVDPQTDQSPDAPSSSVAPKSSVRRARAGAKEPSS